MQWQAGRWQRAAPIAHHPVVAYISRSENGDGCEPSAIKLLSPLGPWGEEQGSFI